VVPEVGHEDLREIIVGDYRIVYRLEPDACVLLTVFRSSRLLPAGLGEL
jgi:mRNA-degrading endonuclease RelE of RelBE toxin-antitoxin system